MGCGPTIGVAQDSRRTNDGTLSLELVTAVRTGSIANIQLRCVSDVIKVQRSAAKREEWPTCF